MTFRFTAFTTDHADLLETADRLTDRLSGPRRQDSNPTSSHDS